MFISETVPLSYQTIIIDNDIQVSLCFCHELVGKAYAVLIIYMSQMKKKLKKRGKKIDKLSIGQFGLCSKKL